MYTHYTGTYFWPNLLLVLTSPSVCNLATPPKSGLTSGQTHTHTHTHTLTLSHTHTQTHTHTHSHTHTHTLTHTHTHTLLGT